MPLEPLLRPSGNFLQGARLNSNTVKALPPTMSSVAARAWAKAGPAKSGRPSRETTALTCAGERAAAISAAAAPITEFAVVIVLHQHRVAAPAPLQKRHSAGQRQNGARWDLVRGRYTVKARLGQQASRVQAITVNLHRKQAGAGRAQHRARARVAGIIDGCRNPGLLLGTYMIVPGSNTSPNVTPVVAINLWR